MAEDTTEHAEVDASADDDPSRVGRGLLDEEMGPSSAMAHLYRGEIHRMRLWRERLDQTTNWAVIIMAAIITWAFSNPDNPHYILLLGVATLAAFMTIEARRFRGYDIWRSRVRTLQRNVFAYGLDPEQGIEDPDWRARLSRDYRAPSVRVSTEEAVAHRLRRVYLPLYTVVLGAWVARITVFAQTPWTRAAAVGAIPGVAVVGVVAACYLGAAVVAYRPREWHVEHEIRSRDGERDLAPEDRRRP